VRLLTLRPHSIASRRMGVFQMPSADCGAASYSLNQVVPGWRWPRVRFSCAIELVPRRSMCFQAHRYSFRRHPRLPPIGRPSTKFVRKTLCRSPSQGYRLTRVKGNSRRSWMLSEWRPLCWGKYPSSSLLYAFNIVAPPGSPGRGLRRQGVRRGLTACQDFYVGRCTAIK
jgi:hypothetical protein